MIITQEMLLAELADGRFHSGVELGAKWGISRASVSLLIQRFSLPGLEVFRVRGKGYRLSERLYPLDKQTILSHLSAGNRSRIAAFQIFKVITSTNSYLLEMVESAIQPSDDKYRICFSETQTAGRGSRGRKWISPFGHNIYFSMLRTFDVAPPELSGLSIVVGLALIRVLLEHGVKGVGFKWPNDIHINSSKTAGILLETRSQAFGVTNVVIGIGINLKVTGSAMSEVDQPWSAIADNGFDTSRRNEFAGRLINQLMLLIEEFRAKGLAHYSEELAQHDLLIGKNVVLSLGQQKIAGIGAGINDSGKLVIQTKNGTKTFSSGEVTIRHGVCWENGAQ